MDKRPIYLVVRGDQVVSGPYLSIAAAYYDADPREDVVTIQPTDPGYDEFMSYYNLPW